MTFEPLTSSEPSRSQWKWVWISLGVIAITVGVFTIYANLQEGESVATVGGVSRVEIDVRNGPVTIRVGSDDRVRVEHTGPTGWIAGSTNFISDGDVFRVVQRCPMFAFACRGDFVLTVPANTHISGSTTNGAIAASGLTGRFELATTNGAISLNGLSGDIVTRTTNGAISGRDLGSQLVDTRTNNGSIELDFAASPLMVTANTSNGRIAIAVPDQPRPFTVDAQTSNGSVETSIRTAPESSSRIHARTSNGDITIGYR